MWFTVRFVLLPKPWQPSPAQQPLITVPWWEEGLAGGQAAEAERIRETQPCP